MTRSSNSVVLLIPAFNAASTLPSLLTSLSRIIQPSRTLVVDDGSSDETFAVSRVHKVRAIRQSINRGKGAALQAGFAWWLGQPAWEALVTMDADGQHAPEDIDRLIETWSATDADIVLGSRNILGTRMPLERRLSNLMTSFLVSARCGTRIPDSQCGYRLMMRAVVERVRLRSAGFEAETEFLLRAARQNFRFAFTKVQTIYGGERSFMTHWTTTRAFIRVLFSES